MATVGLGDSWDMFQPISIVADNHKNSLPKRYFLKNVLQISSSLVRVFPYCALN